MAGPLDRWQKPQRPNGGGLWDRLNGLTRAHNGLRRAHDRNVDTLKDWVPTWRGATKKAEMLWDWWGINIPTLNTELDKVQQRLDVITKALADADIVPQELAQERLYQGCPDNCPPDQAECEWCDEHPWGGCIACEEFWEAEDEVAKSKPSELEIVLAAAFDGKTLKWPLDGTEDADDEL